LLISIVNSAITWSLWNLHAASRAVKFGSKSALKIRRQSQALLNIAAGMQNSKIMEKLLAVYNAC
jgi:hypothetical protein